MPKKKKRIELPAGLVAVKPFERPRFEVVFTSEKQSIPIASSSVAAMNDFLIPIARARLKLAHSRPDYYLTPGDIKTSGHVTADGFVVHRGSRLVGGDTAPSALIRDIRTALMRCDALNTCEGGFTTETDLTFDSPATAASVLLGREESGSIWKDHLGRTIEENRAAAAALPSSDAT